MRRAIIIWMMLVLSWSAQAANSAEGESSGSVAGAPIYYKMEPAVIVNYQSEDRRLHYLQVDIQVLSRNQGAIDAFREHSFPIRNQLIFLFSKQTDETIHSLEGKEQLRRLVLEAIQNVMTQRYGSPGVEAVYFTKFVTQ